jgi:hypothetical protein
MATRGSVTGNLLSMKFGSDGMRSFAMSFVIALFAGAATSCSGDNGGRSDTDAGGCAPGQQVSCACPGGDVEGVQVCEPDGSGFGVCMGCDDASSSGASTLDDDTTTDTTDTTPMGESGPMTDGGDTTGTPGGSESGGGMFEWAWIDHGGPAYLPPPCAATAGVVDGLLVDPQAFFFALVEGTDANDWETVMNAIEPQLWACGLGQQRGSQGNVRGRLFLPTEACPDASPPADDPQAMFLGVRQERACWAHFVDVLMDA